MAFENITNNVLAYLPIGMPTAENLEQYLSQLKTRTRFCPVRKKNLTEWSVPVSHIYSDCDSQARDDQNTDTFHVSALVGGFIQEGQKLGICVRPPKNGSPGLPLAWGLHREDAARQLAEKGIPIKDTEPGHVWSSLYEELPSDLTLYQTLENNLHEIAKRADEDSNIRSLTKIVKEGHLDQGYSTRFANISQKEQDDRLYKIMDEWMPGVKKKSLVTKWRKEQGKSHKIWSFSTDQAKSHFALHDGLRTTFDRNKTAGSNQVFDVAGKKVIMVPATGGQGAGKYMETAHSARNVDNVCDEVWFVAALPKSTLRNGAKYEKPREEWIEQIDKWNKSVKSGKVVDRIMFVPQNQKEMDQNVPWILDHRF
jgi:hypothetical protein